MMNGYNFTNDVRMVLAGAREEAAALSHEYVGTEHILLSLLRVHGTVALSVLENLGVNPDEIRDHVLGAVKRGTAARTGPDLPYTSRAKKTLELAMEQALMLRMNYVGPEHLLLGMIAEEKGIAAQVLADHGVTLKAALAETRLALGTSADGGAAQPEVAHFVKRRPASAGANERLRVITNAAYDLANSGGSRVVGPVHLAIALVAHEDGIANAVFTRLGLDPARARSAFESLLVPEPQPISPEDAIQLDQAVFGAMERERAAARAASLSTAHLALALLDEGCPVAPVFSAEGVTQANFRDELARISG